MGEEIKLAQSIVDATEGIVEEAKEAAEDVVEEALESVDYAVRLDEVDKKIDGINTSVENIVERISVLEEAVNTAVKTIEETQTIAKEAAEISAKVVDNTVQPVADVTRSAIEPVTNPTSVFDAINAGGQEVTKVAETLPKRVHPLTRRWGFGR